MSLYARPSFRRVGPASIIVLVAGMAALWVTFRPTGLTTGNYLGQLAGVEAILLMPHGLRVSVRAAGSTVTTMKLWKNGATL